jgi:hypothetical protein
VSPAGPRTRRTTSQTRVIDNLRLAARKGDRTALALALDEMRTLARIVDLLVIKQGEKIARQKGWSPTGRPGRRRSPTPRPAKAPRPRRPASPRSGPEQAPLFPGL